MLVVGDVWVPKELAGSSWEGKQVQTRITSKLDREWLANIDRALECENSIGLLEVTKNLEDIEHVYDDEVVVEGPISIEAALSDADVAAMRAFLSYSDMSKRLTHMYIEAGGNQVPTATSPLLEYTALGDISVAQARQFSLLSLQLA